MVYGRQNTVETQVGQFLHKLLELFSSFPEKEKLLISGKIFSVLEARWSQWYQNFPRLLNSFGKVSHHV